MLRRTIFLAMLTASTAAIAQPAIKPAPTQPAQPVAPVVPLGSAQEFNNELTALFAAGACGTTALPSRFVDDKATAAIVKTHCEKTKRTQDRYREKWLTKASEFLGPKVPATLPKTVVYPFAGGDLSTALTVFPNATELTTLSLEPAGDPRSINLLSGSKLKEALRQTHYELDFLYNVNFSNTINMIGAMRGGKLPTQLIFGLSALHIHGFEPVSLKYFKITDAGELRYITEADTAALGDLAKLSPAKRNEFFANVELSFKKTGSNEIRIYRHIQANLDDSHIAKSPGVLAHLEKKGKIAAMTKAASYLLTWNSFEKMRGFLLGNAEWMISDATGVAPKWGKAAGFEYETYGTFEQPHLEGGGAAAKSWREEWKAQPTRKLPIRFGYYDKKFRDHMVIMRKAK